MQKFMLKRISDKALEYENYLILLIPIFIFILTGLVKGDVPAVIIGGQLAPYVAARMNTIILEKVLSALFVFLAIALLYIGFR